MEIIIGIVQIVAIVIFVIGMVNTSERQALKVMATGVIILWLSVIASAFARLPSELSLGICASVVFTLFFLYCRQLIRAFPPAPHNEGQRTTSDCGMHIEE